MPIQPGLNAGLAGLIDLASAEDAVFRAYIEGWQDGTSVNVVDITGPGHGDDAQVYFGYQMARGTAQGYTQISASPLPENGRIRDVVGYLTLKATSGKYYRFLAKISGTNLQRDPVASDRWGVQFSWIRQGAMQRVWPEGEDPGVDDAPTLTPTLLALASGMTATLINNGTADTREPHGLGIRSDVGFFVSGVSDTAAAQLLAATSFVSAQPTFNGLKLRGATPRRVGPDGLVLQAQYGLTSTEDDVEFGGSYAVRRYGRPGENVTTTVESATGTEAAIVEARETAFFAEANAAEILARKISDSKAAIRRRYVGFNTVTVPSGPTIGGQTVMLRGMRIRRSYTEAATMAEAVSLYVVAIDTIATNRYRVEFGVETMDVPVRRFTIEREYSGLPIDDKWSAVGAINNAAWNGLEKYTTMYLGASFRVQSNRTMLGYNYESRKEPNIQIIGERVDVIMSVVDGMAPGSYATIKLLKDNGLIIDLAARPVSFSSIFGF